MSLRSQIVGSTDDTANQMKRQSTDNPITKRYVVGFKSEILITIINLHVNKVNSQSTHINVSFNSLSCSEYKFRQKIPPEVK